MRGGMGSKVAGGERVDGKNNWYLKIILSDWSVIPQRSMQQNNFSYFKMTQHLSGLCIRV